VKLRFDVGDEDFSLVGRASSELKRVLARLGIRPDLIRRASIAMYEGEINMVIHAGGGVIEAEIEKERIVMTLCDTGPGIPDIPLAMTEGWSTAPDRYRELGFGAGMGLPNMKRNCDEFEIESEVGKGTRVRMAINI
jgi:anti-sigma regulatory factor (Ser/Thr protein kinase)